MKCRGFALINRPKITILLALSVLANFAVAEDYVVELKPAIAAALAGTSSGDFASDQLQADQKIAVVTAPSDAQVPSEYCNDLVVSGIAKSCSPNYQVQVAKASNDPQLQNLWGLKEIAANEAWDLSSDSPEVVVAVIDTGVDFTHPDLAANMWTNPGELPGDGLDNDGNGYVDDVHGVNAALGSGNPMDDNGHGTHTAGTIGAVGNNGVGVVGVAWRVKIMALRFLNANGGGTIADAIRAINYMVRMKTQYGINIIASNNSWGGGGYSQPLHDAIERARDAGIVFVAAAGNEANNNDSSATYPAGYDLDNVISVAAVDKNLRLAYFSNFGQAVDIAAPGVSIISTVPGNGYAALSGTSMAAPHVAGAIALLAGREPALSHSQLVARVNESGSAISALSGKVRTGRLLNLERLLNGTVEETPVETTPAPIVSKVTVYGVSSGVRPADGGRFTVKVKGSGSGEVAVRVYFNNADYCEGSSMLALSAGRATLRGKLPALSKKYRTIGFEVGGTRSSARLDIRRKGSKLRRSAAQLSDVCTKLLGSIR